MEDGIITQGNSFSQQNGIRARLPTFVLLLFRCLRMRLLLGVLSVSVLAGCAKMSGPLNLYFVSSSRFTSGNKTGLGPADTLATNLYAVVGDPNTNHLTHFTAKVTYSPQRAPFAYPVPLNLFINSVKADPPLTYLDTTLTQTDFSFTPVFGVRTTAGTEQWTYTATDAGNATSSRSFILSMRRSDSTAVYNDYTLKLRVPATSVYDRRYLDLKSGLVLPGYSVLGNTVVGNQSVAPSPDEQLLQQLTDVIVLPDGLRLASPDTVAALLGKFDATRWPGANRRTTRFRLTSLLPTDFTSAQDAITIQSQFTGTGRAYLKTLAVSQVYAFRAYQADGTTPVYGLMRVLSLPNGSTTTGLQLQVRTVKPPR